jgi:uncharacterized protein (TIGR03067 family)
MIIAKPCRCSFVFLAMLLPACTHTRGGAEARLASSTTGPASRPAQLSQLQGKWKIDSVESGDPQVAGDHPWSLAEMTISADNYVVRRADGTLEQGTFSLTESAKPKQVLFFNWGHKDEPRKAVFELKGNVLKVCTYVKDFGEHSCLTATPSKVEVPAPSEPLYAEIVLYTFTRQSP